MVLLWPMSLVGPSVSDPGQNAVGSPCQSAPHRQRGWPMLFVVAGDLVPWFGEGFFDEAVDFVYDGVFGVHGISSRGSRPLTTSARAASIP